MVGLGICFGDFQLFPWLPPDPVLELSRANSVSDVVASRPRVLSPRSPSGETANWLLSPPHGYEGLLAQSPYDAPSFPPQVRTASVADKWASSTDR